MGRPDAVRAAMEERQRRWMCERSAEEARRDVHAEFARSAALPPRSAGGGEAAGHSARPQPPATPPAYEASALHAAAARAHAHTASGGAGAYAAHASHALAPAATAPGPHAHVHAHGQASPIVHGQHGRAAHVVLDRITERLAEVRRSATCLLGSRRARVCALTCRKYAPSHAPQTQL